MVWVTCLFALSILRKDLNLTKPHSVVQKSQLTRRQPLPRWSHQLHKAEKLLTDRRWKGGYQKLSTVPSLELCSATDAPFSTFALCKMEGGLAFFFLCCRVLSAVKETSNLCVLSQARELFIPSLHQTLGHQAMQLHQEPSSALTSGS